MKIDLKYFLKIIILFSTYFITAWVGLQFGAVSGFATLVWPPAGIALAALLIWGSQLWPGIFIGAFLINRLTGAPVPVAIGMAIGNTLEAYVACYLLSNSKGFKKSLENLMDVLRFLVIGAFFSTLIAATVGTASLFIGRVIAFSAFSETWMAWWIGDMLGVQIVGSLFLVWFGRKIDIKFDRPKIIEGFVLMLIIFVFGFMIFGYLDGQSLPLSYIIFIPVIWAAVRFSQKGVVTTAAILSVISIWGTSAGYGPFVKEGLSQSLLYLQVFMGTLSGVGMILAAVVIERGEKEKLLMELNQDLEERVEKRTAELKKTEEKLAEYAKGLEGMVSDRTNELKEKVDDLEKLNKFMVGRELKMIELKDKNKDLSITLLKKQHPPKSKKITKK